MGSVGPPIHHCLQRIINLSLMSSIRSFVFALIINNVNTPPSTTMSLDDQHDRKELISLVQLYEALYGPRLTRPLSRYFLPIPSAH
jgi:hypothetical protein